MRNSNNMSKIEMADAAAAAANNSTRPLSRIRRRSPKTVAAEEKDCRRTQNQNAALSMSSGGEAVPDLYVELNDCDYSKPCNQEQLAERRRAARRRRGGRASSSRPDSSGRIGQKECHILAFTEKLEELVDKAMANE